ncbi:hypothetical protein [Rubeoparvulum massiliense]|uniref:hypothetical protein n=1 Tax=Rubeoparvulum massiliense TaxID=1631346 RepID=UPI00065E7919|nr:hypothetical protein [Rubeoparvulum massiliense]
MKLSRGLGFSLILGIILAMLLTLLPIVDGFKQHQTGEVPVLRLNKSVTLTEEGIPDLIIRLPAVEQVGQVRWLNGGLEIDYHLTALQSAEKTYKLVKETTELIYAQTSNVEQMVTRIFIHDSQNKILMLTHTTLREDLQAHQPTELLSLKEYLKQIGDLHETTVWESWYNTKGSKESIQ